MVLAVGRGGTSDLHQPPMSNRSKSLAETTGHPLRKGQQTVGRGRTRGCGGVLQSAAATRCGVVKEERQCASNTFIGRFIRRVLDGASCVRSLDRARILTDRVLEQR